MTKRDIRGVDLIALERSRQVKELGHVREDDLYREEELASAALCYVRTAQDVLLAKSVQELGSLIIHPQDWPWDYELFKPTGDAVRDLVKAGALISATIDAILLDKGSVDEYLPR